MVIQGYQVPEDILQALDAAVSSREMFRAGDLQKVAEDAGVPSKDGISMRVVERYIQKARKEEKISRVGKTPHWRKAN